MDKQMTIDDYVNGEPIEMVEVKPVVETVEAELVKNEDLNKEQLLELIATKDKAIENYEHKLDDLTEAHKKELKDINDYYIQHNKELTSLIRYYERKLKIINDLVNIETGGEK